MSEERVSMAAGLGVTSVFVGLAVFASPLWLIGYAGWIGFSAYSFCQDVP